MTGWLILKSLVRGVSKTFGDEGMVRDKEESKRTAGIPQRPINTRMRGANRQSCVAVPEDRGCRPETVSAPKSEFGRKVLSAQPKCPLSLRHRNAPLITKHQQQHLQDAPSTTQSSSPSRRHRQQSALLTTAHRHHHGPASSVKVLHPHRTSRSPPNARCLRYPNQMKESGCTHPRHSSLQPWSARITNPTRPI